MSQQTAEMFRMSCGATAPLELNVAGPGGAGKRHVFEHPFVLVGRHERNGLRLEDNAVSRQHAYLQQIGGRVFCVDLGSRTGIRWGATPRPAGWLCPQQGVQIGPFTLELAMAALAGEQLGESAVEEWNPLQDRESESPSLPQITVEQGNEVRARLPMNRLLVLVGSSPACRIRLRDAGVSRFHCSLLRTPQGVWLVDLLYGAGASLNGKSVPWALLEEGDRLHVGPYVLRISYPEVPAEAHSPSIAAIPTAPAATAAASLLPALQAELDQARERLRDAEVVRRQLADSQAECDRLRGQARELEAVRGERDRWQADLQNLQDRHAADLHAAHTDRDRLHTEGQTARHAAEQASARAADLERALAETAAAHETTIAEARAGWELDRQALATQLDWERQSHSEAVQATIRDNQAQADAAAEVVRQHLADSQTECDRLREQARALEGQVAELAGLRARLEAAEASARELEAVRGERDRWQAEVQNLQDRHAADLPAAQAERDRLRTDEQTARLAAEQASARVTELERALEEAAAGHETALALASTGWESDRQALVAQHEQERQSHHEAHQAAIRDHQAQTDVAAEVIRRQLADSQTECDRLREQARALEVQVAEMAQLQARLETAEASALEVFTIDGERDQAEAQDLQARLPVESADEERLGRLAADLHATQMERDYLQTEAQTVRREADEASARVTELERALAEATAAHEAALAQARAGSEPERQALAAQLEQERQTRNETIQAAVRDMQARVSVAAAEWRQRLDSAEQQLVWERGLFQTQSDQLRQQVANLLTDRDYLLVQLGQAETRLRAAGAPPAAEAGRPAESQRPSQQAIQDQVFSQFPGRRP
jgi:pSer/pThr/pTyr-binding forkhead associated (FHA) protein